MTGLELLVLVLGGVMWLVVLLLLLIILLLWGRLLILRLLLLLRIHIRVLVHLHGMCRRRDARVLSIRVGFKVRLLGWLGRGHRHACCVCGTH